MGERVVGLQSAIADERMASAASYDVGVFFEMMQSPPEVICFSVYNWMYILGMLQHSSIHNTTQQYTHNTTQQYKQHNKAI